MVRRLTGTADPMTDYRIATAADIPVIHALLVENAVHDGGTLAGTEDSLRRHGFGPLPRFRVILATNGSAVLGLTMIFPEYSSWRGQVGLFVQDLYLCPAARGQGTGRGLLAAAVRLCPDWDPAFVTLMVQHTNLAARAFYARQGFVLRQQADILICEGAALAALTQAD